MTWRRSLSLMFFASIAVSPSLWAAEGRVTPQRTEPVIQYPETRRVDQVDVYHGTEVADPYRWLEDDVRQSDEVARWVAEQNKLTQAQLGAIECRAAIRDRLKQLWNYERYSAPYKIGGHYFFRKNDGLQNQSVVYVMESLDGEPRVLIDPNTWSDDGTVALAGLVPSDDGRYVAYGVAEAGSDWRHWQVMEIDSGKVLDDRLDWLKSGSVGWTKDGEGFYYSRFPEPAEGKEFQSLNLDHKVYYHRLGTPQSDDVLVYERPDNREWNFYPHVTEDGHYLVITVTQGTDDRYRIVVQDLEDPNAKPVEIVDNFDHEYSFIGNDGPQFYFKTDHQAPRRRVIAMDVNHPQKEHHREIIPQAEETLDDVSLIGDQFIASYLKDAKTQAKVFSLDGKLVREIRFPGIGSAYGFAGRRDDTETFYSFDSFATPPSTYRYDLPTGKSTLFRRAKVDVDPDDYVVRQVFYHSKDGTRVPMFITHKKGIALDGSNPTLLYGYGGFNIPKTPEFEVGKIAWMEMGGVFALANIRGGGEYGEAWHQAGTKLNKQNVFDDFIAAAEWLIDNEYTSPVKLAIQGRSNGGLLVGAVMTQRPDLFGACLPAVGVMDMLRFHKFTAGRYWVDDYGSSDDPEEFKALLAYSPYHNIKPGTLYPPTMVMTADTDDRVVPGHSFKFAAALQNAQADEHAPVIIRIESRAGHGAGTPISKYIEREADEWAFLVKHLGMKGPSTSTAAGQ